MNKEKGIKSVDVTMLDRYERLIQDVTTAESLVAPVPGADDSGTMEVPQLNAQQITQLYNTLRRLRGQINEMHVQLYENGLDMPVDRLCTVIATNLDGYTDREASNLAETLYGPTLIEGLRAYDRIKVAKTILVFFQRRKLTPPIPYWDLLVNNNGLVK
ncbi:hypothetical protein Peetri_00134 [Pseudomonas phage vB_PpuM-Peetri]